MFYFQCNFWLCADVDRASEGVVFPREEKASKCSYFIRTVVMAKALFNEKEKSHPSSHTIYNFINPPFELFACNRSCLQRSMKLLEKLTFYWKFPKYIFIKYKQFDFFLGLRGFYWDKTRRSSEVSQKSGFSANVVSCNGGEEGREQVGNRQGVYLLKPRDLRR